MTEKLKPCPFCGGGGHAIRAMGETWVRCMTCESHGKVCSNHDAALTAWNTRPDEGEPVAVAGTMPGAAGFTTAIFEAAKVPVGTPLYTRPAPALDRDRIAVCISTHMSLGLGIDLPCVEVDKIADAILSLLSASTVEG
jgi:hypothetical protein